MASALGLVTNKFGLIAILILGFFLFGGGEFIAANPVLIIFGFLILAIVLMRGK